MFLFCTKEADQATATSGIRWEGICVQSEIYYKTKQIVRRYVSKSTELEKKKKKRISDFLTTTGACKQNENRKNPISPGRLAKLE